MYTADKVADEEVLAKLPNPVGYHILIAVPELSDTTKGGVYIPDKLKREEETASVVGYVIKLGSECYVDKNKFPNGPWCEVGDFVVIRPYGGVRIVVHGKEMRLVNDDSIEAVVQDPRGIKRVGG